MHVVRGMCIGERVRDMNSIAATARIERQEYAGTVVTWPDRIIDVDLSTDDQHVYYIIFKTHTWFNYMIQILNYLEKHEVLESSKFWTFITSMCIILKK